MSMEHDFPLDSLFMVAQKDDSDHTGCEDSGVCVVESNNSTTEKVSISEDDIASPTLKVDDDAQSGCPSERVLRMWNDPFDKAVCRVRVRLQSDVSYSFREPFMVGDSNLRQQFRGVIVTGPLDGLAIIVNKIVAENDQYPEGYGDERLLSGFLRGYCEPYIMGCAYYYLDVVEEFAMSKSSGEAHDRPTRKLFKMWRRPFTSSNVDSLSVRLMSHAVVTYPGSFRSRKLPFSHPCSAILFRARVVGIGEYAGLEVVVIRCFDEPQLNPTNGVSMVCGRECQVSGLLCSVHLNCCPAPAYYRLEATNVWRNKDAVHIESQEKACQVRGSKLLMQEEDFRF